MSNIKNAEKPKPKTGSTALQEQASLAAIYYTYKKGATLNDEKVTKKASKKAQLELDNLKKLRKSGTIQGNPLDLNL